MTTRDVGLARFDALDADQLRQALLACCASPAWAERLVAGRPYAGPGALLDAADAALAALTEPDLDDALAGHPRIGERLTVAHGAHSAREQSGVDDAGSATLRALAEGNRAYEARFGHVYLVFATGKSAQELLDLLRQRLGNDPATERAIVRGELAKINRLRLERLLDGEG